MYKSPPLFTTTPLDFALAFSFDCFAFRFDSFRFTSKWWRFIVFIKVTTFAPPLDLAAPGAIHFYGLFALFIWHFFGLASSAVIDSLAGVRWWVLGSDRILGLDWIGLIVAVCAYLQRCINYCQSALGQMLQLPGSYFPFFFCFSFCLFCNCGTCKCHNGKSARTLPISDRKKKWSEKATGKNRGKVEKWKSGKAYQDRCAVGGWSRTT